MQIISRIIVTKIVENSVGREEMLKPGLATGNMGSGTEPRAYWIQLHCCKLKGSLSLPLLFLFVGFFWQARWINNNQTKDEIERSKVGICWWLLFKLQLICRPDSSVFPQLEAPLPACGLPVRSETIPGWISFLNYFHHKCTIFGNKTNVFPCCRFKPRFVSHTPICGASNICSVKTQGSWACRKVFG